MKKIVVLVLLITVLTSLFSCGPRRYKCGPYRRCEVKEVKQPMKMETQVRTNLALC
ncbi:hypothetical protein ACFSX9_14175 [Flavobacterium ardleyense]|uniref:Lipoprotein n=1 Tax=Flavobacterium ardleyense TaxID=2038737 RepID=A0ABW5ZB86_9FLAO